MADQAAVGMHVGKDLAGDFAAVEIGGAVAGDAAIGVCHVGVAQRRADSERRAGGISVDLPDGWELGDYADVGGAAGGGWTMPVFGDVGTNQEAFFGILDCRLDDVRQGHGPIAAKRVIQCRQGSRGGDGLVADLVFAVAQDETPAVVGLPDDSVGPHVGARGGGGRPWKSIVVWMPRDGR